MTAVARLQAPSDQPVTARLAAAGSRLQELRALLRASGRDTSPPELRRLVIDRIEQLRALVERMAERGRGRIWLIATSQEKLSDVVQNAPVASAQAMTALLQRLEARFQTNVHLESSEVGSVIEQRILRKLPTARPTLESLWQKHEPKLRDVAESPGLELGANYPHPDREPFVRDYPFLPYQIEAAADIFAACAVSRSRRVRVR